MKAQLVPSLNFQSLEKKLSFAGLDSWLNLVHEMYGYKTYHYAVLEDSQPLAALGLVEINHPIFGHYLATAPFGSYGGLAFENPEVRDLLLDAARRLAEPDPGAGPATVMEILTGGDVGRARETPQGGVRAARAGRAGWVMWGLQTGGLSRQVRRSSPPTG